MRKKEKFQREHEEVSVIHYPSFERKFLCAAHKFHLWIRELLLTILL